MSLRGRLASGTWLPCTVCNGARHNHMPDYSPGCVANRITKPTHNGCEDRGVRLSGFSTARRDHRESVAKYIRPVMPWWCFLRRARTSPCSNADTVSPGRGHTSLWHGAEGRRVASNAHACRLQGIALQMLRPIFCIGRCKHIFWATQIEFFKPQNSAGVAQVCVAQTICFHLPTEIGRGICKAIPGRQHACAFDVTRRPSAPCQVVWAACTLRYAKIA